MQRPRRQVDGARARQSARRKTRASAAKRATRTERAGEAARERACGEVRGAKPLGVKFDLFANFDTVRSVVRVISLEPRRLACSDGCRRVPAGRPRRSLARV